MNDSHGGETVRPTKKQREILTFIEQFIAEHGYSPSYREIMSGLHYTSVATVSLHVNSLIRRGHLRKRDRSARSLEVVTHTSTVTATSAPGPGAAPAPSAEPTKAQGEAWLISRVESAVKELEKAEVISPQAYQDAVVLVNTLKILGLGTEYGTIAVRITQLEPRVREAAADGNKANAI